jgi:hypothetical protein
MGDAPPFEERGYRPLGSAQLDPKVFTRREAQDGKASRLAAPIFLIRLRAHA